jgi:hypothetical protein
VFRMTAFLPGTRDWFHDLDLVRLQRMDRRRWVRVLWDFGCCC